jgi:hypothetical protein
LARQIALVLALALTALPATGRATTLACRPGVREVVYAFRYVPIPPAGEARFHADLESWAEKSGLSVGGVSSEDPGERPVYRSRKTILQSAKFGIVIDAKTNSRSRYAKLTIGNNCWGPREDWRPWWRKLQMWVDR